MVLHCFVFSVPLNLNFKILGVYIKYVNVSQKKLFYYFLLKFISKIAWYFGYFAIKIKFDHGSEHYLSHFFGFNNA